MRETGVAKHGKIDYQKQCSLQNNEKGEGATRKRTCAAHAAHSAADHRSECFLLIFPEWLHFTTIKQNEYHTC